MLHTFFFLLPPGYGFRGHGILLWLRPFRGLSMRDGCKRRKPWKRRHCLFNTKQAYIMSQYLSLKYARCDYVLPLQKFRCVMCQHTDCQLGWPVQPLDHAVGQHVRGVFRPPNGDHYFFFLLIDCHIMRRLCMTRLRLREQQGEPAVDDSIKRTRQTGCLQLKATHPTWESSRSTSASLV